jgi:molybdenum cofactor synthesis domain-containing protein
VTASLRIAVLTVSDRSFRGEREDRGGPAVADAARRLLGADVVEVQVVPDEKDDIVWHLTRLADNVVVDVVLTTGGTGISARDVTPEATRSVIRLELPGLPEAMRAAGRSALPAAMLSRQVAGVRGKTLIVNLPGSPRGAVECLEAIAAALPHAAAMLRGDVGDAHPARNDGA